MSGLLRFPYGAIQKILYDRIKAGTSGFNIYGSPPIADPADPSKSPVLPLPRRLCLIAPARSITRRVRCT